MQEYKNFSQGQGSLAGTEALEKESASRGAHSYEDSDDELSWYLEQHEKNQAVNARTAWEQLKIIVSLGMPISVEKFAAFLPGFLLLVFYGKIGLDEVAGAGFGFMFGNVSGVSVVIGFALGLPPLVSQAFGAGNYGRCGQLLQRQMLIHFLVVLPPVAFLWLSCKPILLALGQPPRIVELTHEFLMWRLPALPFLCVSEDISYFLKAQRVTFPPMMWLVSLNVIGVALSAWMILPGGLEVGFHGGPLAMTLTNIAQTFVLTVKARGWLSHPEAWPQWSITEATSGWGEIIAVSLPSAFMLWGEWWAWEMTLFLAGILCRGQEDFVADNGREPCVTGLNCTRDLNTTTVGESTRGSIPTCMELDVYNIAGNTMVLAFFLHSGYSWGASTQVGNLMGSGDHHTARLCCLVCFGLVASISGTVALTLILFRGRWGSVFSDDKELQAQVGSVIVWTAGYIFLDALGPGALNSLLRALGVVKAPAVVNIMSFYVVGIPLGIYLTFGSPRWLSVNGLWVGLFCGMLFMVMGLSTIFSRVDFEAASSGAREQALGERNIVTNSGSEGTKEGDDILGGLQNAIEMAEALSAGTSRDSRKGRAASEIAAAETESEGQSDDESDSLDGLDEEKIGRTLSSWSRTSRPSSKTRYALI